VWRSRPRALLGSLPWHYTLDEIGAWIVAEHLGVDRRLISYREDRARALIDSPRLAHTRAANSFFTRVCHATRTTPGPLGVVEWRGEEWCARRWQAHVRPDGFARIDHVEGSLEFVLEMDMGTERLSRLETKMERYRIMAKAATAPDVVLFCFSPEGREVSARPALEGTPMPVATATLERHLSDPFGPNWLSLGADRRVPLTELGRRVT
jgi:Replication-relaxation